MNDRSGQPLQIDRLSDEDAQIYKLGRGTIRGHTCKLLVLEASAGRQLPTLEALREHIESRLAHAPRFRQRVVGTPLGVANPAWVDDPDFDVANHVTPVADHLPREELVGELMAEPLRPNRPLWHMAVAHEPDDDAMAIVWRVHHAVADGTTCMRLAAMLLWDSQPPALPATGEAARVARETAAAWSPRPVPNGWQLLTSGLSTRVRRPRGRSLRVPALRTLPAAEAAVARELRPAASPTRLGTRIGARRKVAFASMPLEAARLAGKSVSEQITINDVVLSVIAGAVGRWLGADAAIRAKVPVSLHQRDHELNLGNHDSYFFVDLPVGEADPARRMTSINQETRERKLHHDAETLYHLGLHPAIARWSMSPRVFTFNVSNVPGPKQEVFVLGARLRELYSVAEIAQHHALRVAVISAAGQLFFGLCADRDAVPDLEVLGEAIQDCADAVLQLVG